MSKNINLKSKLPRESGLKIIRRVILKKGFKQKNRGRSPHSNFTDGVHHVTVPIHSKELHPKIIKSILEQAGISEEEYRKLIKKKKD